MKEIFQIPIETDLKHPLPPSYCNSFLDDLKIRGGRRPRGAGGGMEGPTGGLAAVGVSKGVFRGGEGGQQQGGREGAGGAEATARQRAASPSPPHTPPAAAAAASLQPPTFFKGAGAAPAQGPLFRYAAATCRAC